MLFWTVCEVKCDRTGRERGRESRGHAAQDQRQDSNPGCCGKASALANKQILSVAIASFYRSTERLV